MICLTNANYNKKKKKKKNWKGKTNSFDAYKIK